MKNRLYRSRTNKKLGGVCAGLADYFDVDVSIVRIVLCLAVIMHGVGILAYIILWIVVPEADIVYATTSDSRESTVYSDGVQSSRTRRNGGFIAGVSLILIGTFFLLDNLLPNFDFDDYFPLLLIAGGTMILLNGFLNKKNENPPVTTTTDTTNSFSSYTATKTTDSTHDTPEGL